ncbi:MAG: winged helix-turn-helix domain-containing protein [Planctomycetota bacterium]|jgi:hypothetical protein
MQKPQNLNVATDYILPLLWLMDQLESAPLRDAIAAFEESFGNLIPEEHREKNKSGRVKWQHYVMWARFELVRAGLMGSGGRGIWTITLEGTNWLREHPEATASDLKTEIQQRSESMADGFRWQERWYAVDRDELLNRARTALARNPPPEALRYRTWAVLVDGQPVNAKWLFSLATGIEDYEAFGSPDARRALSGIGIEAQRVDQQASEGPRVPATRSERKARRQVFLEQIAQHIPQHLPVQAQNGEVRIPKGAAYVQIKYDQFRGAHYELTPGRSADRLAIHFEASPAKNERRLRIFEPRQQQFSETMGYPVIAAPWGKNWARVLVRLPRAEWTTEQAQTYAQLMGRFVDATFLLLQRAFDTVPAGRVGRRLPGGEEEERWRASRPQAILEEHMGQIHEFLQGRTSRPSDEVLCDWVQFCYTFEMYSEGNELFQLIVPSAVNDWLYQRTKRLAKVCRIHSRQG